MSLFSHVFCLHTGRDLQRRQSCLLDVLVFFGYLFLPFPPLNVISFPFSPSSRFFFRDMHPAVPANGHQCVWLSAFCFASDFPNEHRFFSERSSHQSDGYFFCTGFCFIFMCVFLCVVMCVDVSCCLLSHTFSMILFIFFCFSTRAWHFIHLTESKCRLHEATTVITVLCTDL